MGDAILSIRDEGVKVAPDPEEFSFNLWTKEDKFFTTDTLTFHGVRKKKPPPASLIDGL